jgi:hypothetical protein
MTNSAAIVLVMSGALAAGYAVAALFFLRFWRETRDRLFVFFALAFALLTVHRVALAWARVTEHEAILFYMLRLAAFLLILGGIVDKNRVSSR